MSDFAKMIARFALVFLGLAVLIGKALEFLLR